MLTYRCPFRKQGNPSLSMDAARAAKLFEYEGRDEWLALGEDTRNFICRLLAKNGARRMTATEALAHIWINGSTRDVKSMSGYAEQDDAGIGDRGTNAPTQPTEIRELLLETPSQAEVSGSAKKRRTPYTRPFLLSEQWDNEIRQLQDPNWLEDPRTPPAIPARRPPSSHSEVAETPSSFIHPH